MFAPLVLVAYLTFRTALKGEQDALSGEALVRTLMRHRFLVQLIGMVAILITSLFGMYQNMNAGAWG